MLGLETILAGVIGTIVAVAGAFLAGRRGGRKAAEQEHEQARLKEYRDVRKRVDEAVRRPDGLADDRLRRHGKLRD